MDSLHCDGDGGINRVLCPCLRALAWDNLRDAIHVIVTLLLNNIYTRLPPFPEQPVYFAQLIHRQFQCSAKYGAGALEVLADRDRDQPLPLRDRRRHTSYRRPALRPSVRLSTQRRRCEI